MAEPHAPEPPPPGPGPARKTLISAFVVLNLYTVLHMNLPLPVETKGRELVDRTLSPQLAYRVHCGAWLVRRYAHLAGLDNRWQMFGQQSRHQWRYTIEARTADGRVVPLPLAFQSERTVWQEWLLDLKEAKLQLNLYDRPRLRKAYARYLARRHGRELGAPIDQIDYVLHWRPIRPLDEAARRGQHVPTTWHADLVQRVDCR